VIIKADPTEFAGKRVLVSGGTKGAGRATVDRFRAGGARVISAARGTPEPIVGVEFVQADLTTAEGGEILAKGGARAYGRHRHPRARDRRLVLAGRRLRRPDGRTLGSPS
jgi:NAD(P)-dependent dehydrogenase (short-subunit alcohol dehydrogenase family)